MESVAQDKFSIFVPIEFEKGTTSAPRTGKKAMKFKGIASTPKHGADYDGEILDPTGFDYTPLLKSGHINWNHQASKDPLAIVGEPTSAKVEKGDFHIEGMLYSDSELAQKIYKAAEIMEKSGATRRFGFSIEGNATERDPLNKKYIKKATIMNVAICPTPKCSGTAMQIVKGLEFDVVKSVDTGEEMIVDTVSGDDRVLIDKDMNIAIIKATDIVLTNDAFQSKVVEISKAVSDGNVLSDTNSIKTHIQSFKQIMNGKMWVGSKFN